MKTKLKFLSLAILASAPFALAASTSHNLSDVVIIFSAIWSTMALMVFVLPVSSLERMVRCPGCGSEIDPDVCYCGDLLKAHNEHCGHNPVPMGCDCFRCELPKKTTCHCGKPLNKDGLCWCCDPISTCWQRDT